MSRFVTAYAISTGRKQRVPEHFIGHPVLGRDLRLAPSQRAAKAVRPLKTSDTNQVTDETPATGDDKE